MEVQAQERFLRSFTAQALAGEPGWLAEIRREAIESFAELGFPSPTEEEWRQTNVAPITQVPFEPANRDAARISSRAFAESSWSGEAAARLVFVDGYFNPELSLLPEGEAGGVSAGSLGEALAHLGSLGKLGDWLHVYLARSADYRRHAFTALNTALWRDGAYVRIAKGAVIAKPIHMVFLSSARHSPVVSHPRVLVVAERDSQATLIESYAAADGAISFSNAVSEIIAGENSVLDHYKIQTENEHSFHVATLQVYQARAAQFTSCSVALGGSLVRDEVNSVLDAQGAESTLNGLYFATGTQHVDNHTSVDHAQPHGASRQHYNGILGGRAVAVFNGRILVRPNAQKTDAIQKNRNLLLSPDASIDTKPQLEIFADDVRCTHGATIGQMDAEALFYLRSRGIDQMEARQMLVTAFAAEILERVRPTSLRGWIEQQLGRKLVAAFSSQNGSGKGAR